MGWSERTNAVPMRASELAARHIKCNCDCMQFTTNLSKLIVWTKWFRITIEFALIAWLRPDWGIETRGSAGRRLHIWRIKVYMTFIITDKLEWHWYGHNWGRWWDLVNLIKLFSEMLACSHHSIPFAHCMVISVFITIELAAGETLLITIDVDAFLMQLQLQSRGLWH